MNHAVNLSVFSLTHALVDAACAAMIFGAFKNSGLGIEYSAFLLVLYNVIAFALQAPIGLAADKLERPYEAAIAGCILTMAALFIFNVPLLGVCIAGLGNALFHVGGGIVSLNMNPGKATAPGIYVAPGALGLLTGTLVGNCGAFKAWPFILLLIVSSLAILYLKASGKSFGSGRAEKTSAASFSHMELIVVLMMAAIALRALTGMALDFPWKSDIYLLTGLTIAVVMGKGLGGILADRLGWLKTTVFALLFSAPLIILGFDHPYLAFAGIFLFNLTMPVTLVAIANVLPGLEGFAFGLSTLAIISGTFPMFTGLKYVFYNKGMILIVILISAVIIYFGLRLYFKASNKDHCQFNEGVNL